MNVPAGWRTYGVRRARLPSTSTLSSGACVPAAGSPRAPRHRGRPGPRPRTRWAPPRSRLRPLRESVRGRPARDRRWLIESAPSRPRKNWLACSLKEGISLFRIVRLSLGWVAWSVRSRRPPRSRRRGGQQRLRDRSVVRGEVRAGRVVDCHVGGGGVEMDQDPDAIQAGSITGSATSLTTNARSRPPRARICIHAPDDTRESSDAGNRTPCGGTGRS